MASCIYYQCDVCTSQMLPLREYGIWRSRSKGLLHWRSPWVIRVGLRGVKEKRAGAKPNVHANSSSWGKTLSSTKGHVKEKHPWFYDNIKQENVSVSRDLQQSLAELMLVEHWLKWRSTGKVCLYSPCSQCRFISIFRKSLFLNK